MAEAELKLDTCMADIEVVSQVTDPIPFDPIPFSLLPNGWRQGITPEYIVKLNELPYEHYNHTCGCVDQLASVVKSTGNAVRYATFMIDKQSNL